jgi:hypothetical protein
VPGTTIDFGSETMFRRMFEEMERSSETRWEAIASDAAVARITRAAERFKQNQDLKVRIVTKANAVPSIGPDMRFKYGWGCSSLLQECSDRMKKGEKLTVAFVEEEGLVIGYGYAKRRIDETAIEIIDVDGASRRSAGLAGTVKISRQKFTVGIGHLVVIALLANGRGPFFTDATHDSSRYIFKSLGFEQDRSESNPCILRREESLRPKSKPH